MILEAATDINIDLSESMLIGDRLTNLQAGSNAQIKTIFHVLTGQGKDSRPLVLAWEKDRLNMLEYSEKYIRQGTTLEMISNLNDFSIHLVKVLRGKIK